MQHFPDKISIQYLMQYEEGPTREIQEKPIHEIRQELINCGVQVQGHDDDEEGLKAAWRKLTPSFWRTHVKLHPNYHRVRKWISIHSEFRQMAEEFLINTPTTNPKMFLTSFYKFHAKIQKHSNFENTRLLPFFSQNNLIEDVVVQSLREQHEDDTHFDNIRLTQFWKACEGEHNPELDQRAMDAVKRYVNDLVQHLDLEEEALLPIWLNLKPEQFKTLRRYFPLGYLYMY